MRESYKGLKWKDLADEERWALLIDARAIDCRSGNDCNEGGPCMVDFPGTKWSIAGQLDIMNGKTLISVDDDAEFYDPTEFVQK